MPEHKLPVPDATAASAAATMPSAGPSAQVLARQALKPRDMTIPTDPLALAARDDRAVGWLWTSALMVAMLAALGVWSYYADLEEVSTGNGRVVASQREQIIQSLEGGILQEMRVREGDIVNRGDVLLRIDPMRAQTSFQESHNRVLALRASAARLRAEANGKPLEFDEEVKADKELEASERANYVVRQRSLNESVAGLRRALGLLNREMQITKPMVDKGLAPEVELIKLNRQANEMELQITERINKMHMDANAELVKTEAELAQQAEVMTGRRDQMDRTLVRAPVRGTVKNVRLTTNGGVIQPAQDILEIIPLDDSLLIEAKFKPTEVAFLRPGLEADVKISAYESQIYGSLKGKVEFISPDTLKEERRTEEDTYYKVVIRTDHAFLHHNGKDLPVLPGMTATVNVLTGHRTVANYLLKPVLRIKEAFKER